MANQDVTCGHCGVRSAGAIVHGGGDGYQHGRWVQCANPECQLGIYISPIGETYPPSAIALTVPNLPADVDAAWSEARAVFGAGAFTAAEMMCRKLLMHVAVEEAGAKPGGKFVGYIDELEAKGFITTGLKPTIDVIRARGNAANHELPKSTEAEARLTLEITEHLLVSAYKFSGAAAAD